SVCSASFSSEGSMRLTLPRYAAGDHARRITMTDVVDAPATVKPINHWISGRSYPGQSGRTGPVYNPTAGEQSAAVYFATGDEGDKAVPAAKQACPAWR